MSDIISAIASDIKEYEFLCKYYNEKVLYVKDAYGNNLPDCYGKHCNKLKERHKKHYI